MLAQLRAAATLLGVLTVLLGLLYPLAMTAVAGALFPAEAKGSLVTRDGVAVGSRLVGQRFADARYLHSRPSVAGAGYDASASSGSNLGPTSAKLAERLTIDAAALRTRTGAAFVPADAVTTSGSGLDPDISPAFAELQAAGIAEARGLPVDAVHRVLAAATTGRTLGFLGEPRVNVLAANLALDAAAPVPTDGVPTASASPAG